MPNRTPLFLAKSGYRSRRLSDAARLLPFLGIFLLALPAFWSAPGEGSGTMTSVEGAHSSSAQVGVYIFGVWAGLILVAAAIAHHLPKGETSAPVPRDQI